jgi:3-(3-hydroxy-phenyl)propionate hydroxylase
MHAENKPVIVVGAGPVGMVAAASLARHGVPVIVLESEPALPLELRGSTFHAPTLDMLEKLGAAAPMIAQGLVAPTMQYRDRNHGVIAEFDFGVLADDTSHPFRLQCEQFKLTRILADLFASTPGFSLRFGATLETVTEHDDDVTITLTNNEQLTGAYLIGADGAHSAVRRAMGVEFEGFTWPERFLVLSTPFNFADIIPSLADVAYYADPDEWFFLLRVPGLWRAMFPVPAAVSDEQTQTNDYIRARLCRIVAGRENYEVRHRTLYRVHQRVAKTFFQRRILLAGDAAHVNNPLGGMGLNGGVHDAVNLAEKLARIWHGDATPDRLAQYDRQRRGVTIEHVQRHTITNKQNLEASDPASQQAFRERLAAAAADPAAARDFLLGVSMINSLRRAAEIT